MYLRETGTMPFGNLMQLPLQHSPDQLGETYQPEWDNCLASFFMREETDSWENSESSEFCSTAVNKLLSFPFLSSDSVNTDWKTKRVKEWESSDILCWIISIADDRDIAVSQFNDIDGNTLCNMSERDFIFRESRHGQFLCSELQKLKLQQECQQMDTVNKLPPVSTFKPHERDCYPSLMNLNAANTCTIEGHRSSDESESGTHVSAPGLPSKRRPGRPRIPGRRGKKPEKKTGRLWEFIRDLLLNREYCPSLICWENPEEGVFRFVRSEKVAKLWGTLKENPKMTYEKLSRAMRYYYRSKVLLPVLGRRLVYKFGPSAKGWQPPNPNFRV